MFPLAILAVLVALVALTGGGVVWMVLAGIIAPELATGGSAVVLTGSVTALAVLVARARTRRTERDIHTIRRSQAVRERQPLRYGLEAEADDEPALVRSGPGVPAPAPANERGARADAPVDADLSLWLEPVVAMPLNETMAWRAMAGDGERPLDDAALADTDRARVQLWTIRAAMRLVGKLDEPLLCRADGAILGDREAALTLRRAVEDEPAAATRIVLVADPAALDVLSAGRLDDLVDEGVGLALDAPDLDGLDRGAVMALAERGAGLAVLRAAALDAAMAGRPVRLLREAGIEPVATEVADESTMLRLADMGIERFAGAAFGPPKRARSMGEASAAPALPRGGDGAVATLPARGTDANGARD